MKYWLSLFLFLLGSTGLWAQTVSFTAKVSEKEVALDQYFTVTYTLSNANAKRFIPPSFSNFRLISDQQRSESFSVINGRMSRSQSFSFTIMPKRTGTFSIPPAEVITEKGERLNSGDSQVHVVQNNQDKSSNADIIRRLDKGVFVRMEPRSSKAVVGEQILLDLVLYTREDLDRVQPLEVPEFKDLYTHTIPKVGPSEIVTVNGKRYLSRRLYRIVLFPVKTGIIEVPEVAVQVGVLIPGEQKRGLFGIFEDNRLLPHNLVSKPTRIEVRALDNAPPDYTGAVGQYKMAAAISDKAITTDDALRLRVQVNGKGDIKQVLPPKLQLADSLFEVYEPTIEENINEEGDLLGGFKVFEYVIIPKAVGNFKITPSFTFYDNQRNRFVKLDSSFAVSIRKGLRPLGSEQQDTIELLEPRPVLTTAAWQLKEPSYLWAMSSYWVLMLLPFLAIGGYHLWRYRQEQLANVDEKTLRQGQAAKIVRKRLAKAKELLRKEESKAFFETLSATLWDYASDKLQIPLAELNKRNVQEKLLAAQAQPETTQAYIAVLEQCERAVFAGMQQDANTSYRKAAQVLEALEKQIQL